MDQLMAGLTTLARIVAIGLPLVIWAAFLVGVAAWVKEKLTGRMR